MLTSSVTEACPVCDTLWRLYAKATDNLRELVGKHGDARGQGDQNTVEILTHEINVAESSVHAVGHELRHHHDTRHANQPNQPSNNKEAPKQAAAK